MVILFCISLILGAIGYHILEWSLFEISFLGVLWGMLFVLLFRSKKSVVLGVTLALSVIVGGLRFWVIEPPVLSLGNQAFVAVVERVDRRLTKTLFVVRPDGSDAHIQVATYDTLVLLPGDTVSVRGTVSLPEDFTTETGRMFDYDGYLESRRIDAVMHRAQVHLLEEKNIKGALLFSRAATHIRHGIGEQLARYITFPVDGIVAGMLVGFQGAIPESVSDIFRTTGTLHTLVLSGYNITVLAGCIGLLLRRVPFKIKTLSIFIGIASLVLISGAGVAAVRAGIMGSIALLAGATLNTYNVFRALLLSFLFFFLMNPVTIFVDPGFHLSFLATFFIIALLPILKEKTSWIPEWRWGIKETVLLAVGLPLFMLPYLMYFSGLFPFVSPLANIVMVPMIPLLMVGGVATLIVSPVSFLAGIIGALTSFLGTIAISILSFFSTFPQWNTPLISGWGVVFFYAVFLVLIFRKEIQQQIIEYKRIFS